MRLLRSRPFRALLRAFLLIDLRGQHYTASTGTKPGDLVPPLYWVFGQYLTISAMLSAALFARVDIWFFAFAGLSTSMLLVLAALIVELDEAILHPDDQEIVGTAPVPPQTYAAARVANLLAYVALMSIALAIFPTIVGAAMRDAGILFVPAYLLASVVANVAAAAVVVLLYTATGIRFEGLRQLLAWAQIALILVIFYGAQVMLRNGDGQIELWCAKPPEWVHLLPSGLLADWVAGAATAPVAKHALAAAISVIVAAVLLRAAITQLGAAYQAMRVSPAQSGEPGATSAIASSLQRSASPQPSSQPSNQPSSQPSSEPSSEPSPEPSSKPSSQPSSEPSSEPSPEPSSKPSPEPPAAQADDSPSILDARLRPTPVRKARAGPLNPADPAADRETPAAQSGGADQPGAALQPGVAAQPGAEGFRSALSQLFCRSRSEATAFSFAALMLRRDADLRLRALPSLGPTIAIAVLAIVTAQAGDPFRVRDTSVVLPLALPPVMAGAVPAVFYAMRFSRSFAASWFLRSAPIAQRAQFAQGVRKAVLLHVFGPLLLFCFALLFYVWRQPLHAAAIVLVCGAMIDLAARFSSDVVLPTVPFSMPPARGAMSGGIAMISAVVTGVCSAASFGLYYAAGDPLRMLGVSVLLSVLVLAVPRLLQKKGGSRG